jgi:hypothetical protein
MKPGFSSNSTDLDGFSRFISLRASTSVAYNKGKLSKNVTSKEAMRL